MDVTKEISLVLRKVVTLVKIFGHKAQTNKLGELVLILAKDLIWLLFFGDCEMVESWSNKDSTLSNEVFHVEHSFEVVDDYWILVEMDEQIFDLFAWVIFVI